MNSWGRGVRQMRAELTVLLGPLRPRRRGSVVLPLVDSPAARLGDPARVRDDDAGGVHGSSQGARRAAYMRGFVGQVVSVQFTMRPQNTGQKDCDRGRKRCARVQAGGAVCGPRTGSQQWSYHPGLRERRHAWAISILARGGWLTSGSSAKGGPVNYAGHRLARGAPLTEMTSADA